MDLTKTWLFCLFLLALLGSLETFRLCWNKRDWRLWLFPAVEARAVAWGIPMLGAVILLYVALGVLVQVVAFPAPQRDAKALSPKDQLSLVAWVNLGAIVLIPLMIAVGSGQHPRILGLSTRAFGKNLLLGLLGFLWIMPWVYGVNALALQIWTPTMHPIFDLANQSGGQPTWLLAVGSGVLLAPIAEELIFRGVFLTWFTWGSRGWVPFVSRNQPPELVFPSPRRLLLANVLTSCLFSSLHATQWPAPLAIFVLSLAMGWLYQRTASLVGVCALHILFNSSSTLIVYLTAPAA